MMEGLLISKTGQVQIIGTTNPTDFVDILHDLSEQLRARKHADLLEQLKNIPTDDLVAELKTRATEK